MKKEIIKNSAKLITNWANVELDHEHITFAAYYLWNHEGRPQGRHLDHWLRAQEQLRQASQQTGIHA